MADSQSSPPMSGVLHVRTRLTANFTVISNRLAQLPGSAVTVGVGVYILSLPDGAPVSIAALCAHFSEGEILIARALNELEAAGYLERRRERTTGGRIRTRTFAYDVPRTAAAPPPKPAPEPRRPVEPPTAPADPQAVAVLSSLRSRDPRLLLSEHEIAQLAPAVTEWLARGIEPHQLATTLTTGLPTHIERRPARLLAYRLAALLPPTAPDPVVVVPLQTCDGCERAFRAPEPSLCHDCRTAAEPVDAERLVAVG
ncbi:helix-turn-helix domain-containing protein [Kitasatospora atroaurantiaca]